MNELENVWAWKCEHCWDWQAPQRQMTAVIVKDLGPEISTAYGVERLYVDRKMVICPNCWNSMRKTTPVSMAPPPNPVKPSR
jgi:hypothetical protein